jgi:hypothetical protein
LFVCLFVCFCGVFFKESFPNQMLIFFPFFYFAGECR